MPKTRKPTQRVNFNRRAIESLPLPTEGQRSTYFDSQTSGLGLVVFPSGVRSFFYLRYVNGYPKRSTLGRYPDLSLERARGKAAELNAALSKWKLNGFAGETPFIQKGVPTLGEALESYVERHLRGNAKNPDKAIKDLRWQFNKHLACWRNRPLGSIHRTNIREKHAEIGKNCGEVTANRTLTLLRTIFNHAIDPDFALWEGVNPCTKPKKILFHEPPRERIIKNHERLKFFEELSKENHRDLRDFTLIALATGQRRGTIFSMRWDEVDWQREIWTIPNPKSGKRAQKPLTVPLIKLAISVLKSRPSRGGGWVFPGRKGHLTTLKKPWRRFVKRAGVSGLTIHDLRRSLATEEGDTGASAEAIQKTLGHVDKSAADRIYDRSDRRDEVRDAMTVAMQSMLATGKTSERKLLKAGGA